MSVLPTRLSFMRPIINKIRSLLWKILGVEKPKIFQSKERILLMIGRINDNRVGKTDIFKCF